VQKKHEEVTTNTHQYPVSLIAVVQLTAPFKVDVGASFPHTESQFFAPFISDPLSEGTMQMHSI
jgi:hypothetical protein